MNIIKKIQGELIWKIKRVYPGVIIFLLVCIGIISSSVVYWAWENKPCIPGIDTKCEIWDALDKTLEGSTLVSWVDAKIWSWTTKKIKTLVDNIGIYLLVLAVWSIVYGSLMLTLSAWDDEKIKKAKDIVKWWIIGFIWLISASAIINLVVKIMYSI